MSITCTLHMDAETLSKTITTSAAIAVSELAPCSPTDCSSPKMMKRVDPPPHLESPPTSANHSRPGSRSAVRSRPTSRRNSLHSARRSVPNATIVPVASTSRTTPQERRESLLALHRESVRLFQDQEASPWSLEDVARRPSSSRRVSSSYRHRPEPRTSSDAGSGSAPPSPIASSHSSRAADQQYHFHRRSGSSAAPSRPSRERSYSYTLPSSGPDHAHGQEHIHSPSASSVHVPATVMEWTSPTTRRREYEKIDRASRGVRGLWRRVAPRWFRPDDSRTPFFEEGRSSRGREGSVRRFRMDLPDDQDYDWAGSTMRHADEDEDCGLEEDGCHNHKPHVQMVGYPARNLSSHANEGRRRWTPLRTKTAP
ncbi:hypothetical protein N7474_006967 [Penicillium riverlandense]|uniref:uncharacterized protein n=1 Tax=Penicillium riverlandense TaxID=1903569 RepID=UPI0025468FD3|nr:uncharacterized protein N7474_006967 [Penicillium riverlandense]KAJ5815190.1 hypothetical protein N7474_006967 [Penicillium riverlandense]